MKIKVVTGDQLGSGGRSFKARQWYKRLSCRRLRRQFKWLIKSDQSEYISPKAHNRYFGYD